MFFSKIGIFEQRTNHTGGERFRSCRLGKYALPLQTMNWAVYKQEFKTNFKLAWPVMVGYVGQVLVGLADNIMVGKLGSPVALASISLANSTIFFVMSFGIGFSAGITPLVSEALGLNDRKRLHRIYWNGLLLNTIMGIVLVGLIYALIPVLKRAHQPPEVLATALPYIRIVGVSVLFVMIFQAMKQFADGMGYTKISMHAILVTNVINIPISYVLIYGVWIFPRLEVLGAGLGTWIARLLIIPVFWYFLAKDERTRRYVTSVVKPLWDGRILKKIFSLGVPSGFQSVFEMGIFTASVWLAGTLGARAQAANQIALQLVSLTYMVFIGLGVAATVRTGYRFGRKDFEGLRFVVKHLLVQAVLTGFVLSMVFILLRHWLPWIYLSRKHGGTDAMEVAALASGLLIVAGIFQISDSLQVSLQGALRGMQDVTVPVILIFISYWLIGFSVAWWTRRFWGVYGIWAGLLTGLTVAAFLLFLRFNYLSKKFIRDEKVT